MGEAQKIVKLKRTNYLGAHAPFIRINTSTELIRSDMDPPFKRVHP